MTTQTGLTCRRRTAFLGFAFLAVLSTCPAAVPALAGPRPAPHAEGPQDEAAAIPSLLHPGGIYFTTAEGRRVYLAGSHTWTNGQDLTDTPFDFDAYLDLLRTENANVIRYWVQESASIGTAATRFPYARPGPGTAADGRPRFDLSRFDQGYFDTLRSRVQTAGRHGLYVSIMLFNGWSVNAWDGKDRDPWPGHPFHRANNVNGIDGDPDNTGGGAATETLRNRRVFSLQTAYVAKVIDTVRDLPNVLYEVANETANDEATFAWQNAIVDFVHGYEVRKGGLRHPVGMTAPFPNSGDPQAVNPALLASRADWISPHGWQRYQDDPPAADGHKVALVDTDHVFGIGGDAGWVWKQFTRGYNVLVMDNLEGTSVRGALPDRLPDDRARQQAASRQGVAQTRRVAEKLDLAHVAPAGELSSTGYALADPAGGQYVAYAPQGGGFTLDLSGSARRTLQAWWMEVASGRLTPAGTVAGGSRRSFTAPHGGEAALLLLPR